MGSYSAYAVAQSAPANWKPGEELAASGFIAITFYLFFDINLSIYRTFKKKQGLYYWCMLLGTWGCVVNAIAVVLKSFRPNSEPLWPLYTLLILVGWTVFAPAQLLVFYSRLHLINQNRKLQRWVLIMIIVVASSMIIPTWPLVWQAYNPYEAHISALYSPREAILDRCTQIGYTIAETILSSIYISSLAKLLKLKSTIRQRRVMTDLIYVNVIAVCLDVLTVLLVFLNMTGISHPVQSFSYILKLKLEFMVLNQLMAVAARGLRKETFAERRYHHASTLGEKDSSVTAGKSPRSVFQSSRESPKAASAEEFVLPAATLPKFQGTPNDSGFQTSHDDSSHWKWPTKAKFKKHGAKRADDDADEDEEEEIGLHMWEKRGKLVMEVPWFKTGDHA